jgi:hypothetical protein
MPKTWKKSRRHLNKLVMKKSRVFLSVAFAMAIAAAVITKVHAQPQAFVKEIATGACAVTERPAECGPQGTTPCVNQQGEGIYQDSNCLNQLGFVQ